MASPRAMRPTLLLAALSATFIAHATALAKEAGLGDRCADAFFPALGYLCGLRSEARVPVITGLENREVTMDELKAFSGMLAVHCPGRMLCVRRTAWRSHLQGISSAQRRSALPRLWHCFTSLASPQRPQMSRLRLLIKHRWIRWS